MREISEAEAWRLAGDSDCPVISKEENDQTESAVCLKQFPSCYVLGASSEPTDVLKLYAFDDRACADAEYVRLVEVMRQTGTPFDALPNPGMVQ